MAVVAGSTDFVLGRLFPAFGMPELLVQMRQGAAVKTAFGLQSEEEGNFSLKKIYHDLCVFLPKFQCSYGVDFL